MSDWSFLNRHRFNHPLYPRTDASWGFNGCFQFALAGEARLIRCIASDGMLWQHVSVSFPMKKTCVPSWDLMCRIKDLFWEPEDVVVQYHPPKSKHINNHPGCLHLWRPLDKTLPLPPGFMVGMPGVTMENLKGMSDAEVLAFRKASYDQIGNQTA